GSSEVCSSDLLACRASRLYRYVGDVERATAVLARVQHVETLDRTEDLGRLRSEQANAAISARDYPAACEILRASARLIPPTPDYHFRLRSEEHTSELQSRENLVCRLLLAKKNIK